LLLKRGDTRCPWGLDPLEATVIPTSGVNPTSVPKTSQRAQVLRHVDELPDPLGVADVAGGRISRPAEGHRAEGAGLAGQRFGRHHGRVRISSGQPVAPKERPAAGNVVDLMEALRRSVCGAEPAKASKPSKKPRKAASGQKEMLMPIEGKKAKETPAKKTASKPQRKSAQQFARPAEFQLHPTRFA
jgi:hypothetical protein